AADATLLASLPAAVSSPLPSVSLSQPASAQSPLLKPLEGSSWARLLPLSFTTLREAHLPAGFTRLVILLEDVHDHPEAQRNIGRAVAWIQAERRGAPVLVGLEGAAGPFLTSTYRAFPDIKVLEDVAGEFLDRSFLTGAEHAALTMPE